MCGCAAAQCSGVLEGRSVRVCGCAAAQGSGLLEGRGVRVCGSAAAQGSGVLEGRSVRVCGSEQWGERECLCLTSVSSKNISKKRTPPSSCDV